MKRRIYIDISVIGGCFVANATIQMVHVLASWNFKHIVNLERIKKYNSVNMKNGYQIIEIRTPREILKPGDNDE